MGRYKLAMTEEEREVLSRYFSRNYKAVVQYVLSLEVVNSGLIQAIFNIARNEILWNRK